MLAKVQLSKEERTLVMDPGWILTKNSIMEKVGALFAALSGEMRESCKLIASSDKVQGTSFKLQAASLKQEASSPTQTPDKSALELAAENLSPKSENLPSATAGLQLEACSLPLNWDTPKISRGENYKGLPWVVLDCPRAFGREDVLAIRTLFWWGHYFSVTLHLKGKYKDMYLPVIREHIHVLAGASFHLSISDDEWRHELDSDNYQPVAEGMDTTTLDERTFLKLSAKCELDRWEEADSVLLELYRILVGILAAGSR